MNVSFLPRYFSESLPFRALQDNFPEFEEDRIGELTLAAQLAVNAVLASLGQISAYDGVVDTFLNYNPALFKDKDYVLFTVTALVDFKSGLHSSASTASILFRYSEDRGLELIL